MAAVAVGGLGQSLPDYQATHNYNQADEKLAHRQNATTTIAAIRGRSSQPWALFTASGRLCYAGHHPIIITSDNMLPAHDTNYNNHATHRLLCRVVSVQVQPRRTLPQGAV
ncbi:Hypothetical predicted protein [Xyrichtys novacula]|uniref:Uncharacterized protein n=1 Tax=Xyrichtys novacula TaxID=13765 RepID=A0AAV1GAR1_XYRNO|nr:Hypothetical predicted protein [Xyrichtys novacula]